MKYSVSYSRKVRVAEFDMLEVSLVQEFDDSLTPRESGFMTVRDFVEERTREETKRLLAERVSGLEPAKTEAASIIHKPSVPITVETVTEKFPQNLKGLLYFQDAGEAILIKPRQYLGTEDFKAISEIVRDQLNGEYISAGKESHFRIPKGKAEATASKPEPPRTIGFIDETPKIPSFDPRTLTDHEWKNKKLAEGSYTKGSLSWGWDFADQFPEFVIQVLRKEPLEIDYKRTFIEFDASSIPDYSAITGVVLKFYRYANNAGTSVFHVHQVLASWSESTITWNNQPTAMSFSVHEFSGAAGTGWWNLSLSGLNIKTKSDLTSTFGFRLKHKVEDGAGGGVSSYSKEYAGTAYDPILEVTYSTLYKAVRLYPTKDSHIQQDTPTTNYGTSTLMKIRYSPGYNARILVEFDISSVATFVNASLRLYVDYSNDAVNTRVYRITGSWTETGVTWNNQPSISSNFVDGPQINFDAALWSVNVTSVFLDDSTVGFMIIGPSGTGLAEAYFTSREYSAVNYNYDPQLLVYYTTAPTNDDLALDLTGASYKGTKTLLAAKQDYKFVYKCSDQDGVTDITYAEIRLDYASKNVVLRATRGTGDAWTFSEQSDPNNYLTLNVAGSSHSTSGNQKTLNFLVKINWNWDDASETLGVRAYVVDSASTSDQDDYANIFGVENDLSASSLSVDDYRCNLGQTLTISGYWHYEGTSIPPPDGDYQVKVKLSGVQKGSTDTTLVSGVFSISDVTSESTVGSYSYTVEATYMASSGSFPAVIVDRQKIVLKGSNDTRLDVGAASRVYFNVTREYDNALFDSSKGTVYFNATAATWDGTSKYWYVDVFQASVGSRAYQVSGISDTEFGITTLNDAVGAQQIIWDRAQASVSVSDSRINMGENASITVSGIYEYDSTSFSGAFALNDTTTQCATAGKRGFKVAAITDSLYGLTVFTTNEVSVVWDGLKVDVYSVDMASVKVYVRLRYAYDDNPVDGGSIGLAERTAVTNSSGWAVFDMSIGSDFSWGQTAYGVQDASYGIMYKAQNQTLPIARKTRFMESDAEISALSWDGMRLTVDFANTGTYTLKVSGSRPVYVKGVSYDLSVDYNSYLSLAHLGERDIVVGWPSWGDFYIRSLSQGWLADIYWTDQKLTLVLNGTSGTSGTLTVYCGSRGMPKSWTGFTDTPEYNALTTILTGQYRLESQVTITLDFTMPVGGGGGARAAVPAVTFTVGRIFFDVQQGRTVDALLDFTWVGVNEITITNVQFGGAAAKWLSLAETLPKTVTKQIGEREGYGEISIRIIVPSDAQPGEYTVPATVDAEAVGSRLTTSGYVTFRVVQPSPIPSQVPDYMTYLFAAILVALVAAAYLKR